VFLAVPLIEAARWRVPVARQVAAALGAAAAFLIVFTPQMAVWNVLYGRPFAIPQGPAFMQWTSPHPIAVLFSDNHGLFTWAPLLILALVGLAALLRRDRQAALPVVTVLVLSWYASAAVSDWWAGEAFGARRFLSLFPLFVAGLAAWMDPVSRAGGPNWRHGLVGALVAANLLLLLQYQLFMKGLSAIAPYPSGWIDLFLTRLVVPLRLVQWWLG
jgi:hypothetical protein